MRAANRAQLALSFPAHRHVVCFSGGHSSACVGVEVVRRYGPDDVVLLNHDINPRVEDADVKRFKREVAAYLGLPITYANHPRWEEWDQFDVVRHAGAFQWKPGQALCTARLKSEPFEEWCETFAPPGSAIFYYGFDAGEGVRIQRRASILAAKGYETAFPLAHWRRTIQSTRELGVEPPLTYSRFRHANCAGCLKAGRQHWYVVFRTRPDVWAKARHAEDVIGHTIINGVSLEELEPLFADMQRAGIEPTEHVPQQSFWAEARRAVKAVRALPVLADEKPDARPCDCVL